MAAGKRFSRWSRSKALLRRAGRKLGVVKSRISSKGLFPKAPSFQKRFPDLAAFISRETVVLPGLERFRIHVSDKDLQFYADGTPLISGDALRDSRLVQDCKTMHHLEKTLVEKLREVARWRGTTGFQRRYQMETAMNMEMIREAEESINRLKRDMRETLFVGARRLGVLSPSEMARDTGKPYSRLPSHQQLRLFVQQEMAAFPFLSRLRTQLVQLESAPETPAEKELQVALRKELLHPDGAFRFSGEHKTDLRLSKECSNIFLFRNAIRQELVRAGNSEDLSELRRHLDLARRTESKINQYKEDIREALLKIPLSQKKSYPKS